MKQLCLGVLFAASSIHCFAETRTIDGDMVFGCLKKSDYDEVFDYIVDNDQAAFVSALKEKYVAGLCTVFSNGDKVYLVEATFGGMAKVRKQGQTKAYWILGNGLK